MEKYSDSDEFEFVPIWVSLSIVIVKRLRQPPAIKMNEKRKKKWLIHGALEEKKE